MAASAIPNRGVTDASEDDSSDEQQVGAAEDIQGRLFEKYIEACDELSGSEDEERDTVFAQGLARVAEWVSVGASNSMCLICLGSIKPSESVWHCSGSCYAVFHLPCMQDWARSQLDAASLRASNAAAGGAAPPRDSLDFHCPKCRCSYAASRAPRAYTCFCGKQEDPEWDPWLAPHTCGELCSRQLPGSCSHACRLLCHPGPCPPCPLVVDASCHCGKRRAKRRCGQRLFSCHVVCGRRLECGHACESICHEGECPPCDKVGAFRCACGAEERRLPCSERAFHCERVCGKPLGCGRHKCEKACHVPGGCGGCPLEGRRSCPCGKAAYGELRCDEQAPPCGGTCGKALACGLHTCTERCHHGECSKVCRDLVVKPCRCGRTQKEVLCSTEVLCELRCTNMRACGRHACRRRCCDGSCPPCEETCGRKLRCGNHKCPAPCHSGPCRPCPLTFTVACACGRTKHTLPCGAEAKAAAPRCQYACPIQPTCRHAGSRHQHRCHYGPCPPCKHPCGSALQCGHTCPVPACHDLQAPPVADWEQPKPPKNVKQTQAAAGGSGKHRGEAPGGALPLEPPALVAAAAAKALVVSGALTHCPPCMAPVTLPCFGGHCSAAMPCHQASHFPCQAACGRPLPCGNHSCSKPCHVLQPAAFAITGGHASASFDAAAAEAVAQRMPGAVQVCETCKQPCSKARAGCSHPCPERCHPGACPPCVVQRTHPCHCGKTTLPFTCHELQRVEGDADGGALCCGKPCHRALATCQHPCREACHSGPCPQACKEEVTVRCDCRRLKQKWGCDKVRAALSKATGCGTYDSGTTALKLLPCDVECAAQQQAKAARGPSPQDEVPPAAPVAKDRSGAATSAAADGAAAGQEQQGGSGKAAKRMSRAEREALAAQRVAQQLAAERRKKMMQWALMGTVVAAGCGIGLWVAVVVYGLLVASDEMAKQTWGLRRDEL